MSSVPVSERGHKCKSSTPLYARGCQLIAATLEWLATNGVEVRPLVPARYVRRADNQVSAELEAFIQDLLARGRTKTAIARALRVNRRVVIRVAREATEGSDTKRTM